MEFSKEQATKALDIAEKKLSKNDYDGAKRFVNKAQRLYPETDGLKQVSMMIDVYVFASDKINGEPDWYGVLGVDPLANEEVVKKQYKKLALLLHPDKNKFIAEEAFKLVLEASCVLSDKHKRSAYDHKRKIYNKLATDEATTTSNKPASGTHKHPNPHKRASSSSNSAVWTMCNSCKKKCVYMMQMPIVCLNCRQPSIGTEQTSWKCFFDFTSTFKKPEQRSAKKRKRECQTPQERFGQCPTSWKG